MHVRLAFSVAIQVDAEILLIDEVLAVGDARFQQKCFDEFQRLKREGRTILFVTHDMSAVERFCDRAMLLDKGKMVGLGEPAVIARRYNELNFGRAIHELTEAPPQEDHRTDYRDADIVDGWFEDTDGTRVSAVAHRERCFACIEVHFNADVEDPIFGITLRNDVGATVFATTTAIEFGNTGRFESGEVVLVRLRFDTWLTRTSYKLTPSVARAGLGADAIDVRPDVASLVIHGGQFTTGVVDLPHEFEIERR
jgi:hypothetical protein